MIVAYEELLDAERLRHIIMNFAVAVAKKATATIVHVARLGQSATLVVLAPRGAIVAFFSFAFEHHIEAWRIAESPTDSVAYKVVTP